MSEPIAWLSLAIWLPILTGLAVLLVGSEQRAALARWIALSGALLGLLVTLPLIRDFDRTQSAMQFVEKTPWIEFFSVNYHLGVDGISLWFVLLIAFITIIVPLTVFFTLQRYLVRGLLAGSVKGG